jgi:energy-coupling factor transporter ATP-binding protein EcfA2
MFNLVLENIRTFSVKRSIPIRPLTVLTGENSSGKSTFLSMLSVVGDPLGFPFEPGFNRAPYNLGNYDTIATYKGGKFGRAKTFSVGYTLDAPMPGVPDEAEAVFRGRSGQAELESFSFSSKQGEVTLKLSERNVDGYSAEISVRSGRSHQVVPLLIPRDVRTEGTVNLATLLLRSSRSSSATGARKTVEVVNRLADIAWRFTPYRATSIAPIRSKPERVYGQVTNTFEPAGDHVPFVLERLFREQASSRETQSLSQALVRFGEESGMFKRFAVRSLGSKAGDPFQLMVALGGRAANLIDVGYGVSQALPVVVQSVLAAADDLLLMQQPEVHLHPKAQAALGSFFANLVSRNRKRMVIETHSDYIIDRIRQEVASGLLKPTQVAILFFERQGIETTVYPLDLDRHGNIVDAPACYREFFLEEEFNLLHRTGA